MSKKILTSCIVAVLVILAAILSISSCGRNGRMTSITVVPENVSIIPGTTQQFQAQGLLSDGSTFFLAETNWSLSSLSSSSTPTIALIDPVSGILSTTDPITGSFLPTGTVSISAADPYSSFTGTTSLTVDLLSSITITPTTPSTTPGLSRQFYATGILVHGATQDLTTQATLSWTSDATVATVVNTPGIAGNGVVSVPTTTTGTATITACILTSDGTTTVTKCGSTMLTVTSVPLSSLTFTPTSDLNVTIPLISSAGTSTHQYDVIGTYADTTTYDWTARANWTSSNPAVATIVLNGAVTPGLVTAVAPGATAITATDPITGIAVGGTLTVAPLSSITVTPTMPSMTQGSTYQFTATGTYANAPAQDLTSFATWTSTNPGVATVTDTGMVTSISTGTAIIQASILTSTITGTTTVSGSTTLVVTSAPLASIAITPVNASISANGATQQFGATGTYSDGTTRDWTASSNWSSSNTAVATIQATGLATAVTAGMTTITATDPITNTAASTTLTVTP